MNKLTKISFSALCGSLAAMAANAGSIDVTGSASMTHTSNGATDTGNPLGMDSALTFKGSGELDGGQTVTLTIDLADKTAYSAASIALGTNSLGTFKFDQGGGGGGIGGYDDVTPTAWEESWGAGLGAGIDFQKGVGSAPHINWTSPTFAGSKLIIAYTPRNGSVAGASDKTASGDLAGPKLSGYDIMLDLNTEYAYSLPNIFIGGSHSELDSNAPGANLQKRTSDHEEVVVGLKYAIGPLTLGAQASGEFTGSQTAGETEYYANAGYGVSFNVNDNLSVSYGEFRSRKGYVGKWVDTGTNATWNTARNMDEVETSSLQLAYTMGGASFKIADNNVENASYADKSSTTGDLDGTTIALTLAF